MFATLPKSDSSAIEFFGLMIFAQIANHAAQTGLGLGSVIAVVCSWQRNRSILWAILAGILSWIYVIYFAITRTPEETNQAPNR